MPILCRLCLDMRVPEGELIAYLDKYVSELPDGVRVSDGVYKARLNACADCPERIDATCRLCGCYVQARAAKKRARCPIPGSPRWTEDDDSETERTCNT